MIRQLTLAATLIGLGLLPTSSRAAIEFTLKPVKTTTNVGHFTDAGDSDASTAVASTLSSPRVELVNIKTIGDMASVPESGAAFISSLADTGFTQMVFTPVLTNTVGFTVFEFALEGTGTFNISAVNDSGQTFFSPNNPYTIGNGEFRIGTTGDSPEYIKSITINVVSGGITSFRQIQVTEVAAAVPEPATLVTAAMGIVLAGAGGLRRRLRSRKVAA